MLNRLKIDSTKIDLEFVDNLAYGAVCDSSSGAPVIKIDPIRFSKYPDVVLIASLCHELGHYRLHHLLSKPSMEQEEQADQFCGEMMHTLGFQRVDEICECLFFTPEDGNFLYPSKKERELQIEMGWKKSDASSITAYQSFNPLVFWKMRQDSLIVTVNDKTFKPVFEDRYAYGMFYDSSTFSTYELLGFSQKNGRQGQGRLVSNKTAYCYKRIKNKFSIYRRGNDYELPACVPPEDGRYINDEGDLIVECYDKLEKRNVTFIFRYYDRAPDDYFLPAYIK
jgi:hypothetical protein